MRKRGYGLLLAVCLLVCCSVPAWGAENATLTIVPDITETVAGKDAVEIVYTITVTPPPGKEVGVFSFQLHPSGQMTLPGAFTEDGETVIAYAPSGLKYSAATDQGVFSTYEYTPTAAFFAAVGSTAERRMTAEAEILTIHATVPAGISGAFVLDADFTIAQDGSGVTYDVVVDSQPVIISPSGQSSGGAAPAAAHSGAVAVTGLTLPAAGQVPDTSVTVDSSLPGDVQTAVTWLCDGEEMSGGVFEPEHVYTVVLNITASEGTFDETVAANSGFTVRRADDTHLELRRSFRVEEYYTETVSPQDIPSEEAPLADTPPGSADAPQSEVPSASPRESARGGLTALVVLAGLAVALGAIQLFLPGGVMALLRPRKKKSAHES